MLLFHAYYFQRRLVRFSLLLTGLVTFVYLCFIHNTCINTPPAISLRLDDIVVVVLSQGDQYHAAKAQQLTQNILQQAAAINQKPPSIRTVHKEFPHLGAWTVVPLLPWLNKLHCSNSSWFFFAEEKTQINLTELITLVKGYDKNKAMWMGHGLIHKDYFIPHRASTDHGATPPLKSKYPLFAAGFVMSTALIVKLSEIYEEMALIASNFSLDASYDLALFVEIPLVDLPDKFCIENRKGCVSFPEKDSYCGDPVPKESIFFAVKTCAKYRKDRVPVVKSTWAKQTAFIEFFSHVQDSEIPTTAVRVRNTKNGHCQKTFEILDLVNERIKKELPSIKWVMMADDDTLISVPRLQSLLSCWPDSGPLAIGERYGYNVQGSSKLGFNYLTGGAGIVISPSAIPQMLEMCACPRIDQPEDMVVGQCLTNLSIPLVHTPTFHQDSPIDYAFNYLAVHEPVTFHRFLYMDPLAVYSEWFSSSDNHAEL